MRELSYAKAINEALQQALSLCPEVCVWGQLVDYKPGVFGTTTGLADQFGNKRVQDFQVSEALMTSAAIGTAVAGMRPVLVHQRVDFMFYSLDAIANWMALWRFKSGGRCSVPVTIRMVVGKGWGQGPQHSKSIHAWFAHLPGLRVAMPSTAFDAKGLLLESIFGEDPTIIVENRSLFSMTDHVPEMPYRVRFGQAARRRTGSDVTFVAISNMVPLALKVAEKLTAEGIEADVLDLRTVCPLDKDAITESVAKTRRLVVFDPAWKSVSVAAEVMAIACESAATSLAANPMRVCLPDSHTPVSSALEKEFYPDADQVVAQVRNQLFAKTGIKKAA